MITTPSETLHHVNGITLNVLANGGEGRETIVFLHGFPGYSGVWAELMTAFGGQFRCLAPDLHGFNRSSKPKNLGAYRIATIAADIAALIETVSQGTITGDLKGKTLNPEAETVVDMIGFLDAVEANLK